MSEPKRFLIFNNGMIGNTLFNMPAAAWLKQYYPGCFVGMVVDKVGLELVNNDPNVDSFHTFNKKKDGLGYQFKLIMALRKEQYDVSLHLRKGVKNEIIARLAGAKFRAGYWVKGSWQHLHVNLVEEESVHRLESRAILMREAFGKEVVLDKPKLVPGDESDLNQLLKQTGVNRKEYLVIHPSGFSQSGMAWSPKVYGGAVKEIAKSMPVFVICMPNEQADLEQFIPSGGNVRYYTGSVATTSALIRAAKVFVGNDSGPAHIASAWGTPRLVVYTGDTFNFEKWKPINMTDCHIQYSHDITPQSVIDSVMELGGE